VLLRPNQVKSQHDYIFYPLQHIEELLKGLSY
jgi:hypothetical protein